MQNVLFEFDRIINDNRTWEEVNFFFLKKKKKKKKK